MTQFVSVGWHNKSDDSVNSTYLETNEAADRVKALVADSPEVDHIWTLDEAGNVVTEWRRTHTPKRSNPVDGKVVHPAIFVRLDGVRVITDTNLGVVITADKTGVKIHRFDVQGDWRNFDTAEASMTGHDVLTQDTVQATIAGLASDAGMAGTPKGEWLVETYMDFLAEAY